MVIEMMVSAESIKKSIEEGMALTYLTVEGDGRHFEALVVSEEFAGKSRVQRHQRVYQALGGRMREEIHALSMKTRTPEEWENSR